MGGLFGWGKGREIKMSAESKHGLIRMGISRSAIAHDSEWDTDPALCHRVMSDILGNWIAKTSIFLMDEGIIRFGDDCRKLMRLYLERSKTKVDSQTIALKILYDSKMAQRALDSSSSDGKHKAAFHIWHATRLANQLDLLTEEKTIQDARKKIVASKETFARENLEKRQEAEKRHSIWQKEANVIWKKSPNLSVSAVARAIKTRLRLSYSERTIRGAIRKT